MKDSTRNAKASAKQFHEILGREPGLLDLLAIREHGKTAFDDLHKRLGAMLVESILQVEREEFSPAAMVRRYIEEHADKGLESAQGELFPKEDLNQTHERSPGAHETAGLAPRRDSSRCLTSEVY